MLIYWSIMPESACGYAANHVRRRVAINDETKFSAMRRFCKAVIPGMQKRNWGRIVNISSIGGIYPNPQLTVSHALSAAINNDP
jgi:NADP-dependent 3-hydroxy acid dehydrogenase YdfG